MTLRNALLLVVLATPGFAMASSHRPKRPVSPRVPAGSPSASAPVLRDDLSVTFAKTVCAGEVGALPFKSWAAGVHDAQIEGRFITRADGLPIDTSRLEHAARAMARLRGAGGYAFGRCEGGRGWAMALPAPKPLSGDGQGTLHLPVAALESRCASWRADFAPRDKGVPQTLAVGHSGVLPTAKLGDGVLSLTCQPKSPRWRGPWLWYLMPVGKGPAAEPPLADALQGLPAPALGAWINQVRAREGLPPLIQKSELAAQASLLSTDGSLVHDRLLQKRVANALSVDRVRFLGEDRVKARDVKSMAWLLWSSPRHRDLLLAKDATVFGLATRDVGDERLAVVITGATAPLTTATGPKPHKSLHSTVP